MKKNIILVIAVIALAGACVWITIGSVSKNAEMSHLLKEKSMLLSKNKDLETEIVKSLSSSELLIKSDELGFVKPETPLYISQTEPVAKLP